MTVKYDWDFVVQKAWDAAIIAYRNTVKQYKPTNPKSKTYQQDISQWQRILDMPKSAEQAVTEKIQKKGKKSESKSTDDELVLDDKPKRNRNRK